MFFSLFHSHFSETFNKTSKYNLWTNVFLLGLIQYKRFTPLGYTIQQPTCQLSWFGLDLVLDFSKAVNDRLQPPIVGFTLVRKRGPNFASQNYVTFTSVNNVSCY